jgi:hypothetical protein
MGMDAKATIWVGVREEDCDIYSLMLKLPSDLLDENGDFFWLEHDIDRIVSVHGCNPVEIKCNNEICGFGVEVFTHDWDSGPQKFDSDEVRGKIAEAKLKLREFFDKCGIEDPVDVWCQTDWS